MFYLLYLYYADVAHQYPLLNLIQYQTVRTALALAVASFVLRTQIRQREIRRERAFHRPGLRPPWRQALGGLVAGAMADRFTAPYALAANGALLGIIALSILLSGRGRAVREL